MPGKLFYALFVATITALPVSGKTVKGNCIDEAGEPVSYVNVIVGGTKLRSVSDKNGGFSINIPDSLVTEIIVFSHISFNTVEHSLSELPDKDVQIVLYPRILMLEEAMVAAKGGKMRNLNFIGSSNPLLKTMLASNFRRDPSMGEKVKVRKKANIKELEFKILGNTYDSLIMRTVLYNITKEGYRPLMAEPHYFSISRGHFGKVVCDLSNYGIVVGGDVLINLEKVYSKGRGEVLFPMYYDGGRTVSFLYPDREEELSICGIGLQLRGYYAD